MEFGRRTNLEESEKMVECFTKAGHKELDTAAVYSNGQTEEYLGQIDQWKTDKLPMATKINAWGKNNLTAHGVNKQLNECLERMKTDKVDILYLHAPDYKTSIVETLKACDKAHKAGKFKELGLSNYAAWQVAEVVHLCRQNNWIQPTVYQGMYSLITRQIEFELFPCLKHFNIRFYAYSPLGGGILSHSCKIQTRKAWLKTSKNLFF